uniref:Uncharacterized protein n=1 Tax=Parascaris equorum TaxID=6256 RepID=A0A914RMQ0_PAREQ
MEKIINSRAKACCIDEVNCNKFLDGIPREAIRQSNLLFTTSIDNLKKCFIEKGFRVSKYDESEAIQCAKGTLRIKFHKVAYESYTMKFSTKCIATLDKLKLHIMDLSIIPRTLKNSDNQKRIAENFAALLFVLLTLSSSRFRIKAAIGSDRILSGMSIRKSRTRTKYRNSSLSLTFLGIVERTHISSAKKRVDSRRGVLGSGQTKRMEICLVIEASLAKSAAIAYQFASIFDFLRKSTNFGHNEVNHTYLIGHVIVYRLNYKDSKGETVSESANDLTLITAMD